MKSIVEQLCGPACAGRRAGSPEGRAARAVVLEALREAGLDPREQPVPACGGANVLATIPGDDPRYVLVGAHYDHLGRDSSGVYWGADDNAAAVAILVEVARALAKERAGRGVILAAFDGEEPPFFAAEAMGSQHYVRQLEVPIDLMVCMDLVGHRFGPEGVADEVGDSLFVLGAERSAGTEAHVRSLKRAEPGLVARAVDAEIIPPLSDYLPFWEAKIPFVFLSAGRSRVYHTIHDTPDKLDYGKMERTARWLTRFVRESRAREPIQFEPGGRADAGTLSEMAELVDALAPIAPEAATARGYIEVLKGACDASGRLPETQRDEIAMLVAMLESRLA